MARRGPLVESLESRQLMSAVTFTIDPTLSSLVLGGTAVGSPIVAQGTGGLTTTYGGSILANVTSASIQFTGGVAKANNGGSWAPAGVAATGLATMTAPANYGATDSVFGFKAFLAVRNAGGTITSNALPIAADGTFAASAESLAITTGEADYSIPASSAQSSSISMVGAHGTNKSTTKSKLVIGANGQATLTISLDVIAPFTFLSTNDVQAELKGTIVAHGMVSQPVVGSIAGIVYNDANGNTTKDTGETGLAGVTLFVDANKNGIKDTTETVTAVTNSTGVYKFAGLAAGTYRIAQVVPTGYRIDAPAVKFYDVVVGAGANVTASAFADTKTGLISGNVFNDVNASGTKDGTEGAFAGLSVYIDANKNGIKDVTEKSVTTDSKGNYILPPLAAGTYRISVATTLPTTTATGTQITAPTIKYVDVALASGQIATGKNFGVVKTVLLSGKVLNDATSAPLAGVRVFIDVAGTGMFTSTDPSVLTTAAGTWSLVEPAGKKYILRAVLAGDRTVVPATGSFTVTPTTSQAFTFRLKK
jgi:hypothetical protein